MLTSSFPRYKGDSAGIFVFHLCRWLVKKGVNIEVLTPHHPGCPFTENWQTIRILRFPYFYPFELQRLCYGSGIIKNIKQNFLTLLQLPFLCSSEFFHTLLYLRKSKPDIIHAHWTLPQGLVAIMAKRILKIPCVASIHGSDVYGLRFPFLKALNKRVIKYSDVCTANSIATERFARKVSGIDSISVLPMGVDTDLFSKYDEVAFLKKQFKIQGPVILSVGRLIDWKGTAYLIKALPEVLKRFPLAKAFIIGSGPQRDELLNLAERLGVQSNIIFIDKMPQAKLVDYYSLADVFVLPSIVNEKGETEGLGVVLLEAMACELPVIATHVGGIPDIIRDGQTGLLVRPKDAQQISEKIITLLTDEKLRKALNVNGRSLIEKTFSWDVISNRFKKIYHHALSTS